MSSVIWVNSLRGGVVSSDQSDKAALYRHAGRLDQICSRHGLRKLSEFHDLTDMQCNLGLLQLPEGMRDTYQLMAEQGNWFDPAEGLEVVQGLRELLQAAPVRFGILRNDYAEVMADLLDCQRSMLQAQQEGGRFHLCVVM